MISVDCCFKIIPKERSSAEDLIEHVFMRDELAITREMKVVVEETASISVVDEKN